MGKRILFVSPGLAMPSQHGGCVYPHALLQLTKELGHEIHYAWLGSPLSRKRPLMRSPFVHSYVDFGYICNGLVAGGLVFPSSPAVLLATQPVASPEGERLPSDKEKSFIARLVRRLKPDSILIDSTVALPVLDKIPAALRRNIRVSVLTHNVQSRRTELYRESGQALDFLPLDLPAEKLLLERADVIIAIQDREAAVFRKMLPNREVVTVTMPQLAEPLPPPPDLVPPTCMFIGGFSGHNIAGLSWLLAEVWPLILQSMPSARLKVFGTVCKSLVSLPANVEACGPVANTRDAYASSHVALAPLTLGTGLKIKVVEAIAHNRPVVTTPFGAEGFAELESGRVVSIAGKPEDFARQCIQFLNTPALRKEAADRQNRWLADTCSPQVVKGQLSAL